MTLQNRFILTGVGDVGYNIGLAPEGSCIFTVPDGVYWEIQSLFVLGSTTATVGDRYVGVRFTDSTGLFLNRFVWSTPVPASQSFVLSTIAVGHVPLVSNPAGTYFHATMPFAPIMLPPGTIVYLLEEEAIDVSDTYEFIAHYKTYKFIPETDFIK